MLVSYASYLSFPLYPMLTLLVPVCVVATDSVYVPVLFVLSCKF